MKSISRVAVVVFGLMAIGLLSRCGGGQSALQESPQTLVITTASLPNGTAETAYSQTIQASGGVAPYGWNVTTGALPHNLLLSSSTTNSATLAGTPDVPAQALAFTIKVTDSATHSAAQAYTISILPEPDILSVSPASLNFSRQLVGNVSAAQTETLSNIGSSVLNIASITIVGNNAAEFNQSASTCGASLASGANCTISVTFKPSQLGPRGASIAITDDTAGSPQSVSLDGVGVTSGPNASLSAMSLNFGSQGVNTTSPAQSITLSNYGNAALNITGITASANFAETNNCSTSLASAASCIINVTFRPGTAGVISGTLSINDNASGSPQAVALGGSGVGASAPGATLSSTSLNFGSLSVNTTSPAQTITLSNAGNATLNISGIAASASFSETHNCGTSLASTASCTINVTFTPTTTGAINGTLSITDNASGSPQTAALSGTGAAVTSLQITSGTPPSGTVGKLYDLRCPFPCFGLFLAGFPVTAAGGVQPYSWSWTPQQGSSLPPGLMFPDIYGYQCLNVRPPAICGKPTIAGTYGVVVTVTDSDSPPSHASKSYTIHIFP